MLCARLGPDAKRLHEPEQAAKTACDRSHAASPVSTLRSACSANTCSDELEEHLNELGRGSRRSRELAALDTRKRKDYGVPAGRLRDEWRARAEEHGFGRAEIDALIDRADHAQQPDRSSWRPPTASPRPGKSREARARSTAATCCVTARRSSEWGRRWFSSSTLPMRGSTRKSSSRCRAPPRWTGHASPRRPCSRPSANSLTRAIDAVAQTSRVPGLPTWNMPSRTARP